MVNFKSSISLVKEPIQILYRRYVIARIYTILSMLTTLAITKFEPGSIYYQHFILNSGENTFVLLLIGAFTAIAVLDLIVNDLMPNKYKILILYNNRHLIYMSLALSMYGISAAIVLTDNVSIILLRLWLDGLMAAVVAVLDVFARHGKGMTWQFGK